MKMMINWKRLITYTICALLGWGCEVENLPQKAPVIANVTVTDITESTAKCTFNIEPVGATQKAGVIFGTEPALQSGTSEVFTTSLADGNISLTLNALHSDTLYYYRAFIADKQNSVIYSETGQFRTQVSLTLNVSAITIEAPYQAANYRFNITSDAAWSIASSQDWCTVQPASGNGDREITVSVTENATGTPRTATLTVTAGNRSRQVKVEQDKENTTLGVSVSTINAPYTAGNHSFHITSNTEWTIESNQNWCTVQPGSGNGDSEITISVTENTTATTRTATLTITAGNESRQVTVEQDTKGLAEFGNGIVAADSFGGGNGTQGSPYLIYNARQLKKLVDDVNKGNSYTNTYFKLTTDIQVTASEWIPIGYGSYNNSNPVFIGSFDGNGHAISGTLKSDKYREFGFFGRLAGNAQISNLTIAATVRNEGNFASSSSYLDAYTGAIAGNGLENSTTLNNCHITGTVSGGIAGASFTGGVLGRGSATIQNCYVSNNITGGKAIQEGSSYTGGIVGHTHGGVITSCTVFASATVTGGEGRYTHTGGIAGVSAAKISDCTNNAAVTGGRSLDGNSDTGGISGYNDGEIIDCRSTGNVTGSGKHSDTGGIAGYNHSTASATINNCTSSATVTGGGSTDGSSNTGGIVGANFNEIINCTMSASGMVIGGGSHYALTGGIAGVNIRNTTEGINYAGRINNSTNNAAVVSGRRAGGLAGENRGEIHTSLNTGNISGTSGETGGLAGWNDNNDYTHIYSCCTNRGTVNGQAANVNNQIGSGKDVEPCPDGHTKR